MPKWRNAVGATTSTSACARRRATPSARKRPAVSVSERGYDVVRTAILTTRNTRSSAKIPRVARPRVLVLTSSYPAPEDPVAGVFVREHARAAAPHAEL